MPLLLDVSDATQSDLLGLAILFLLAIVGVATVIYFLLKLLFVIFRRITGRK
jgi:hypothetical protein